MTQHFISLAILIWLYQGELKISFFSYSLIIVHNKNKSNDVRAYVSLLSQRVWPLFLNQVT